MSSNKTAESKPPASDTTKKKEEDNADLVSYFDIISL